MGEDERARAFDLVAGWHGEQGRLYREMSEDYPRIDEATCVRAGDASRYHFGSAAALRLKAADIRRALLSTPVPASPVSL